MTYPGANNSPNEWGLPPAPIHAPTTRRRNWILPLVVLVVILALAAAGGFYLLREGSGSSTEADNQNLYIAGTATVEATAEVPAALADDSLTDAPHDSTDLNMPMNGKYSGEVSQMGKAAGTTNSSYQARLEIADDASSIAYPSLDCAARLVFEGMDNGEAVYREVLTEGMGRCDDGGTWWITAVGYHELKARYSPQSDRYSSTALMHRKTWDRGDDSSERW